VSGAAASAFSDGTRRLVGKVWPQHRPALVDGITAGPCLADKQAADDHVADAADAETCRGGVADRGFDGSLWFFTSDDSSKAEEVSAYGLVNVAFAEPKDGTYVSISGPATLVRDPAKARALWTPAAKLWFPGGAEDPRLILLKVDIVHAEYWDEEAGGMRVFLSLLKSVVTGHPPLRMGEHKQIG